MRMRLLPILLLLAAGAACGGGGDTADSGDAGREMNTASDAIVPFTIDVPDAVLEDLQARLEDARFPDELDGAGWTYGADLAYMRELVTYWRNDYDWPRAGAAAQPLRPVQDEHRRPRRPLHPPARRQPGCVPR